MLNGDFYSPFFNYIAVTFPNSQHRDISAHRKDISTPPPPLPSSTLIEAPLHTERLVSVYIIFFNVIFIYNISIKFLTCLPPRDVEYLRPQRRYRHAATITNTRQSIQVGIARIKVNFSLEFIYFR